MTDFRTETDSLGPKQLQRGAVWGIHTARALENFPITRGAERSLRSRHRVTEVRKSLDATWPPRSGCQEPIGTTEYGSVIFDDLGVFEGGRFACLLPVDECDNGLSELEQSDVLRLGARVSRRPVVFCRKSSRSDRKSGALCQALHHFMELG